MVASLAVLAGAVVIAAGAGIGSWLGTSSSGADYTVTIATVEQTVTATGTPEPVNQDDVNLQTCGHVSSVGATIGQQVTGGETLAQIATASREASVAEATATLAADQARLDEGGLSSSDTAV